MPARPTKSIVFGQYAASSFDGTGWDRPSKSVVGRRSRPRSETSTVSPRDPAVIGYVPGLPPPDYFTSGASKRVSPYRQNAMSTGSAYGSGSGSYSRSSIGPQSYRSGRASQGSSSSDRHDDDRTLSPADSISCAGSRVSTRSGASRRSRQSPSSRDPAQMALVPFTSGQEGMSNLDYGDDLDRQDFDCEDEGGYGPEERPYFDRRNGFWLRDIKPDWAR